MQLRSVKIKLLQFCAGFESFCVGLKRRGARGKAGSEDVDSIVALA